MITDPSVPGFLCLWTVRRLVRLVRLHISQRPWSVEVHCVDRSLYYCWLRSHLQFFKKPSIVAPSNPTTRHIVGACSSKRNHSLPQSSPTSLSLWTFQIILCFFPLFFFQLWIPHIGKQPKPVYEIKIRITLNLITWLKLVYGCFLAHILWCLVITLCMRAPWRVMCFVTLGHQGDTNAYCTDKR